MNIMSKKKKPTSKIKPLSPWLIYHDMPQYQLDVLQRKKSQWLRLPEGDTFIGSEEEALKWYGVHKMLLFRHINLQ